MLYFYRKAMLYNSHRMVERRTAYQEQTMDAKEHVKRDLLQVFRTYKAQTLSMHAGPLETRIRGYNARWKEALQGAIDDLVAEGLMERQGNKMALTEQGKEAVLS